MREANHVLGIIHERGQRGLPVEDLYRQLFNPTLYLQAYGKIYRNDGAMTKGATTETVDAMSLSKIGAIIEALRYERYRWTPVRRIYIEKPHSTKLRPLGLPSWSDKLLQEVMRSLLEAYYEPQFSPLSHGFRPGRSPHTALTQIGDQWQSIKWLVDMDIREYFTTINHDLLMSFLAKKIEDKRFLCLIQAMLDAGYLEEWTYHKTYSGVPQGGLCKALHTEP